LDSAAGIDFYPRPFCSCHILVKRNRNESTIAKLINKIQIMDSELKNGEPDNTELEKSRVHIIVEIIEYMTNSVVSKTIIRK
jgi:hypothetical protein